MTPLKIFVSYTRTDKDWAWWIGGTLRAAGHTPFLHEWELPAGGNIPAWMEKRLGEADRAIGVFSDAYCDAVYSGAERNAAIWRDEYGTTGFFVPVEVRRVAKWPVFTAPLSRLSLVDCDATEAEHRLLGALEPPAPPVVRPPFPGIGGYIANTLSLAGGGGDLGKLVGKMISAVARRGTGASEPADASARRRRAEAAGDMAIPPSDTLPVIRPTLPPPD